MKSDMKGLSLAQKSSLAVSRESSNLADLKGTERLANWSNLLMQKRKQGGRWLMVRFPLQPSWQGVCQMPQCGREIPALSWRILSAVFLPAGD